jgi:glycine/D-amino acid oxidase-like deaminating enzyme
MIRKFSAVVVGAGIYGCCVALHLRRNLGFQSVCIVEREADILGRASLFNQARVHNGYHYPRSVITGQRSRSNFKNFVDEFSASIVDGFTKIYCIARTRSSTSAKRFEHFCDMIGAPYKKAGTAFTSLFDANLIEQVYEVDEVCFDAIKLRKQLKQTLEEAGIEVLLQTQTGKITFGPEIEVQLERAKPSLSQVSGAPWPPSNATGTPSSPPMELPTIQADVLFNCTYAGLKHLSAEVEVTQRLKYEIAELALIDCPKLAKLGVTVMDGPFFSMLPYPPANLHSLSHVKYTPHLSWFDDESGDLSDPYAILDNYGKASRAQLMMRDAAKFMPILNQADCAGSFFEIKAILVSTESDDARPILFEHHEHLGNVYSVMGGKIDNIYDVIQYLSSAKTLTPTIR